MAKAPTAPKTRITVSELSQQWSVYRKTIINWIESGELRAVNVARNPNGLRPRYRIDPEAVAEFERNRQVRVL